MANQATSCPATVDIGPWGGKGGVAWDFMPCTYFTGIKINYGDVVYSLTFERKDPETGENVILGNYGGTGGAESDEIWIDGSEEYWTKISGSGTIQHSYVESLTFYTNKGTYGPYGPTTGTVFENPLNGKVVGFFGREGYYIDAIGIHVIPDTSRSLSKVV